MRAFPTTPTLALATLALTGALLTGCGTEDDPEPTSGETRTDATSEQTTDAPETTVPAEPTDSASAPTETEPPAEGVAAPIYFTGETPLGLRLYREFHQVEGDNPLEEAAAILVAGASDDPDYGTLLQGVTVASVEQTDGAIVVTLGEDSPLSAGKGVSPKQSKLAIQSLVYTLQGVAQTRDPVVVQLADGSPASLYDQPTGEGVTAAPENDVLSLVSLTTPAEGATASGTLAVEGVANSFEATVPLIVLDESGAAVIETSTMAEGAYDKLYPYTAELDISALAPGTYTLVARTDDPTGGEGPGPFEDTRTFVVE